MAVKPKPWQSDAEIEAHQGGSLRHGYRQYRPPQPRATYGLLITFIAVFLLELVVRAVWGDELFVAIFTVHSPFTMFDWVYRPWTPITATLSHGGFGHLFFNGLALYFFGPTIENVLGIRKYLLFFFATGALSSIIQTMAVPDPALGASGAIMAIIGMSIILMPKSKLIIFPFPIPIPLWVGGIAFALIDVLGVFNPASSVGNFAHLSGMAVGLVYGLRVKKDLEARGLRLVTV